MRRWLGVALSLALGAGCATAPVAASARYLRTKDLRLAPRAASAVAVYRAQPPQRPFEEVGILTAHGIDYLDTFEVLRKLAGDNGCDALSSLVETVSTDTETVWGAGVESWDVYHLAASCLVFLGPASP